LCRGKLDGKRICVHGDEPATLAIAAAARKALEQADVRIATLPEMRIANQVRKREYRFSREEMPRAP